MNCLTNSPATTWTQRCIEKSGRAKKCGQPARTWKLSKHGTELGTLDLCQRHCDDLRQRGYGLVAVEKAKEVFMIPVRQTVFGYPHGNCMAACVASLLELPIEEMPVIPDDANFNDLWNVWLAARGFARVCFSSLTSFRPDGYYLMAGPSPRPSVIKEDGERAFHVVVGFNGKPVHDPHPDNLFLEELCEIEIIYPLDPAQAVKR
jgi:hypothetical protein